MLFGCRFRAGGPWSGRQDSNLRPPAPKAGALAKLSYAPEYPGDPLRWRADAHNPSKSSRSAAETGASRTEHPLVATGTPARGDKNSRLRRQKLRSKSGFRRSFCRFPGAAPRGSGAQGAAARRGGAARGAGRGATRRAGERRSGGDDGNRTRVISLED